MLLAAMPKGAKPVMHSDMGWQHQNDWCVSLRVGIVQGMFRKDSRPGNAATELVFGHLENELFHGGQWPDTPVSGATRRPASSAGTHEGTRKDQGVDPGRDPVRARPRVACPKFYR